MNEQVKDSYKNGLITQDELDKYWNIRHTLTYNFLINIIVGNRGGGKTYGSKQWCIDNFIKNREQFGYIRRYKDDLKKSLPTFFKKIQSRYPDYEFKVEGTKLYIRLKPADKETKWTDEDIAGYGFILSTANNLKSVEYPNVTTLVYDEFILDNGHQKYLPDEPRALLNLYETIARPGTDHPRVRLFMLANAITVTNPYFLYWDLKMPVKQDKKGAWIYLNKERGILVEDVRKEKFIEDKYNSDFGKVVKGTTYGGFSIENKFLLDDSGFIEKKSPKARYYFTFTFKDYTFGVWADFNEGKLWVSEHVDPSFLLNYSLTLKDHKPNTLLISTKAKRGHFKTFTEAFKNGNLYFETMNIKNLTYEVIKMVLS